MYGELGKFGVERIDKRQKKWDQVSHERYNIKHR